MIDDPQFDEFDVAMRFLDGSYECFTMAVPSTHDDEETFSEAIHRVNEEWEQGAQVVAILGTQPFGPVRKFARGAVAKPQIVFLQGGGS